MEWVFQPRLSEGQVLYLDWKSLNHHETQFFRKIEESKVRLSVCHDASTLAGLSVSSFVARVADVPTY
jgi:hypothetical protein